MAKLHLLQYLPEELLQNILGRLRHQDLQNLNLASKWCYSKVTPLLWRDLELVDCRTQYTDANLIDEHDDSAIIKKLALLARKPDLAACVQTVLHRCHLPPPGIFQELPRNPFCAQTLSADPRTVGLVRLAVAGMRKVHTVRVVLGHPMLTDALLRCFFDAQRVGREGFARVRKLWLENCRVSAGLTSGLPFHPYGLPLELDFTGLESARFRRLPMRPGTAFNSQITGHQWVYSRGGTRADGLQDGVGGQYTTTCNDLDKEFRAGENYIMWLETQNRIKALPANPNREWDRTPLDEHPLEELYEASNRFDHRMYLRLWEEGIELPEEVNEMGKMRDRDRAVVAYRGNWLDPDNIHQQPVNPDWLNMQRERISSADAAILMLKNAGATLTSLNLDWVLNVPQLLGSSRDPKAFGRWCSFYLSLFSCRFPRLRAFQFRNCVVPDTLIPQGLYLLDHSFASVRDPTAMPPLGRNNSDGKVSPLDLAGLLFMEAHPSLQCLGWPMDHFFSHAGVSADIANRVEAVIENLGRTLVDLRIDTLFSGSGEPHTEETDCIDRAARSRRRLFVTEFAAKMKKLESIKIEGGMPRDERREIVRALHACPLQKIVMIGICSPLGNTWGSNGADVDDLIDDIERNDLEQEDKAAVFDLGNKSPQEIPPSFQFEPQYGWAGVPPMLHTLASFHGDTVKELKFCGYKGSPVLFSPTAITTPLLSGLKHFHALESVIMSMWLVTTFEGASRDNEVISYWTTVRSPQSTALVHITDEEPDGWERELRTKYAPDALAWRITNFLGPLLSERAKGRKGGVHTRVSFCAGDFGGIFDIDLWIGKGAMMSDVCLGFRGPREELEGERRRGKLEGRRWF